MNSVDRSNVRGSVSPGSKRGSTPALPTGTLERGLHLLGLFTADKPDWTLRELREESGLPKATVRRIVLTLERWGWVVADAADGTISLGPRILQSSYAKTTATVLSGVAHPHLQELSRATTESALLAVWGHEGPLTLDLVTTPRHFKPYTSVGMVMPGIATADAQVLNAFAPTDLWEARFMSLVGSAHVASQDERAAVFDRWRHVRRVGVAFDREQWKPGVCAVAAPVLDGAGEVLASVSVVMSSERAGDSTMTEVARVVSGAAVAIAGAYERAKRQPLVHAR